jgi:2',3'-cyclic-nucleotide 2'-phosphodiesterase (5'-nucleotidase family)
MASNSRHRKNHKKKVNAYKQKVKDKKNSVIKKLKEQFNRHFASEVQNDVNNLNQTQD